MAARQVHFFMVRIVSRQIFERQGLEKDRWPGPLMIHPTIPENK
jgi:hypothetical protein